MKKLSFLLIAILFMACQKPTEEKTDPTPDPDPQPEEPVIKEEDYLRMDAISVDFDCKGGSQVVHVTASSEPKVNYTSIWCNASLAATAVDSVYDLTVYAPINIGDSRECIVYLTSGLASLNLSVNEEAYSVTTAETTPVTPAEIQTRLGMGWNLGNQMDAHNNGVASETAWGNKKATQQTFDKVKAAGISTVRIPVTWLGKVGASPEYKITASWLDRVYELVGYAEKAGLNVIINMHHDGADSQYWLSIKDAAKNNKQNSILAQYTTMWYQIAEKFKDKGDFLIFEPFNEIQDGGWGWGDNLTDGGKQYKLLNEWLQAFVKTVRLSGGCNATRWLSCPGYSANPDLTMANMVIPTDYVTNNRLIVAVHDYDPYDYTLECNFSEWGHTGAADKKASYGDETAICNTFSQLKTKYVDAGYPVYIGEMGCSARDNERAFNFAKYYLEYFVKAAHEQGLTSIVWENGATGTGKECSCYFTHDAGNFVTHNCGSFTWSSEDLVKVMVKAATETAPEYTLETVYDSAPAAE